jgi:methylthioadenosine phosphorylase (EC 2.4.2.28)
LKEEYKPMDFVIPDQFVDRTTQRKSTFFTGGIVAHMSFADPVCPELSRALLEAGKKTGNTMHFGGTYLNMEGPAFSTKAESKLYRSWGMDVIGMTNLTEAKLAREAEICYSTLSAVTDYDCWYPDHGSVTVEMIIQNLIKNVENAKKIIKATIKSLPTERKCNCQNALQHAIVTSKEVIPVKIKKDLKIIIGKYIK